VRLIQHDDGILADIWINKTLSLEHTVRHVLDPSFWAGTILKTDGVANLLAETAADLLGNTFCNRHGSDTTWLCAAYSTVICKTVFGKILRHLSCLAGSCVPDNNKDLVLFRIVSEKVEEYWGCTYISDRL
jgi:hypothetical protein